MTAKKYSEALVLRRLRNIQLIHDAINEQKDCKSFYFKDKIAYILWQNAGSRNSDIYLAIEFYKLFYSKFVENNIIKIEDLFDMPKMYDIQRARADIQNTEGLFPAKAEVRRNRKKREAEFCKYFRSKKYLDITVFPDYYLYLDESGKNKKYFILAGILLNGETNDKAQRIRFGELKKILNKKYKLNIQELKFTDIQTRNIGFYKEFIDTIFKEGIPFTFVSILVENKGLTQRTEKYKEKELLEIFLKEELASLIVRATCGSEQASNKARISITLDKHSCGYDAIQKKKMEQDINVELQKSYKYLIELECFEDIDSEEDVMVQLADLYASSINNMFSEEYSIGSKTAKCKREFATYFLQKVGLSSITKEISDSKSNIKFINKVI